MGLSGNEAMNAAAAEVINVTPWSVTEIIQMHGDNSNWEMIMEKSIRANTSGGNLFNGFIEEGSPQFKSSRAYWLREFLSECGP